jgi:hypothetical protein
MFYLFVEMPWIQRLPRTEHTFLDRTYVREYTSPIHTMSFYRYIDLEVFSLFGCASGAIA